ncbi:Fur family transcriptional regulator Irr [Bradyrhizobium sp.]|uniref:Fur family transcriptional regulator Irr n=1 Tax=Bradyrhizobium sp. TaxID=376 RepID=UPI003C6478B6
MDTLISPTPDAAVEFFRLDAETQSGFGFEAACADYSEDRCTDLLRGAGLRPTRQRLMLGQLMFAKGDRHVTADMLYTEALAAGIHVSQATVYNTLNQFTQAGLLRRIGPDGSRSFFDTNTSVHPHFFVDGEDVLFDVPEPGVLLEHVPEPLPGHEISRVDVIVHLRRKQS